MPAGTQNMPLYEERQRFYGRIKRCVLSFEAHPDSVLWRLRNSAYLFANPQRSLASTLSIIGVVRAKRKRVGTSHLAGVLPKM